MCLTCLCCLLTVLLLEVPVAEAGGGHRFAGSTCAGAVG